MKKAVIYCRVSTTKQKTEGGGLESQEHRCREYAIQKGYEIKQVFRDDFSGGGDYKERPAMRDLILFLDSKPYDNYVVIFDDLKRLARDVSSHWGLRSEFEARKATVECLNFNFDDTPEGEFIETIIAANGELERKQNKRQVCQKMKARLERGYWCFHQPIGLQFIKDSLHGKLLTSKEPEASILKETLEGYAEERFSTLTSVAEFLTAKRIKGDSKIYAEGAKRFLKQPLYAGLVGYKPWGVERMKGHHKGFISEYTFDKIQNRLSNKAKNYARKDNKEEFPLRNFVVCTDCGVPITASWTTGRAGRKYPYYRCLTKGCIGSIKKVELEDEFLGLLDESSPTNEIMKIFEEVFLEESEKDIKTIQESEQVKLKRIKEVETDISKGSELAFRAKTDEMREVYEEKVSKLKAELKELQKTGMQKNNETGFGNILEKGRDILKNPLTTWEKGDLRDKQMIQNIIFKKKITYNKNLKFGNTNFTLLYTVLTTPEEEKFNLVEMAGIEPASKDLDHKLLQS